MHGFPVGTSYLSFLDCKKNRGSSISWLNEFKVMGIQIETKQLFFVLDIYVSHERAVGCF